MSKINEIKDKIQQKALQTHRDFGGFSTLALCTGAGKSRCAILRAVEIVEQNPNARILLACFTTDQRDNVWRLEFNEWGYSHIYENNVVERVCYVSLGKVLNQEFDFVILDEEHHLTESTIPFFETCNIKSIMGLTATPPSDQFKKEFIDTIAPISFVYPVEQGIKDGVVAPYEISIVYTELEKYLKTVTAGSKLKPFKQTELSAYTYWDGVFTEKGAEIKELESALYELGWSLDYEKYGNKQLAEGINKEKVDKLLKKVGFIKSQYMKAMSKRTNIIYNSYHKTRIGKRLVSEFCNDNNRYLFFAGSIAQSEEILPGKTYNSESTKDAFNRFMNLEDNMLCAVRGLNEGTNISELDFGIILQMNSKELDIIQRIGRVIRVRDGHVGKIIIVCVKDTRDEGWMKRAISGMKKFISIKEYSEYEFFEKIKQQELVY